MDENPEIKEKQQTLTRDGMPFYPLHFMKICMVLLITLAVLFAFAGLFPAHINAPADLFSSPENVKPDWYFLALYQMLKYVPNSEFILGLTYLNIAVIIQALIIIVLVLVPFLDKYEGRKARRRPFFTALGVLTVLLTVVMMYIGYFSGEADPLFHTVFR